MIKYISLNILIIMIWSCTSEKDYTGKESELLQEVIDSYEGVENASYYVDFTSVSAKGEEYNSNVHVTQKKSDNTFGYNVRLEYLEDGAPLITYNGADSRFIDFQNKKIEIADTSVYDNTQQIKYISGNFIDFVIKIQFDAAEAFKKLESSFDTLYYKGVSKENGNVLTLAGYLDVPEYNFKDIYYFYFNPSNKKLVGYDNYNIQNQDTFFMTVKYTQMEFNIELEDDIFTAKAPMDFEDVYWKPEEAKELLAVGETAPEWTLSSQDGEQVSLSDYKGKVILLDFWGTWCHWCKVAFPKLKQLDEDFPNDKFEIVGISCQEREGADPAGMLKENGLEYKTMLNGEEVAQKYNVSGYPTIYIIGKDGKVLFSQSGYSEEMRETMGKIISENL